MKKVLFIGNSHTFFENLPFVFTSICKQAGLDVHAVMLTFPGCDLRWHIDWSSAMANIRYGKYDFVVLQQRSHPFDGVEALRLQGKELHAVIAESGAKTVLLETWSEKSNPEGQLQITEAFAALHNECEGSVIAACGSVWHSLRDRIDLYAPDGGHQNAKGAYVNACVLMKTMFGLGAGALPTFAFLGEQPLDLSAEEIQMLQEAAFVE